MDIETHRAPGTNLVYLRTLKCASTFYSELFLANGWIKQTTKDIDWNRDRDWYRHHACSFQQRQKK